MPPTDPLVTAVGPIAVRDVLVPAVGGGPESRLFLVASVTAVVGLFVAYQAFRGYRRNDSRPMLFLAIGLLLLTTVPFGLSYTVARLTAASDALVLLVISLCNVAGLASILYSLTRA